MLLDHQAFDRVQPCRSWRQIDAAHAAQKPEARAALQGKIADLKAQGSPYAAIAAALNDSGTATVTGKAWTAGNARKLLAQK